MPKFLRTCGRVLAGMAGAVALSTALPAMAAPAAGPLQGKTLGTARELQSGLESLAGGLLAGSLAGEVTRVVVVEDSPRRLVVAVSVQGFDGGRLWGEVLESARTRQAGVTTPTPVTIGATSGDLELVFEATDPALARTSPYLRINVSAPNRSTAGYRRTFELGKAWSPAEAAGSGFLVTITPRPVGRTAELGPRPSVVVPTGRVVSPPPVAPPAPVPAPPAPAARTTMERRVLTAPPAATRTIGGTRAITPAVTGAATSPSASPAPSNAALRALSGSKAIRAYAIGQFGLTPADTDHGARGPAAMPILPFADVRTENLQLDLPRVLRFGPEVYPDQNAASGIYYFVPSSYALSWSSAGGYELRTVYAAADAGGAGQVLMAARLEAGIDAREVALAADLVRAHAQAHGLAFRELRALPIDSVTVSLAEGLGPFSVRGDRVSVHGLSDVMGQMDVSWTTDERSALFVREALVENVGLGGDATFHAVGGGLRARRVPVRIRLADEAAFGAFHWDRTGWRNTTPYPATLRWLHALRVTPGQPPVVHSWSLGDVRVPPGGQVRWNASAVPFWLDGEARRMWLDYAVDGTCAECGAQAIAPLVGGVSTTGGAEITFHTLTPLADAGAIEMVAEVRSRFWDPGGRSTQVRRVVMDGDGKDFRLGPLFVPSDAGGGAGEPLFEYRLQLTMQDGRPADGEGRWLPSRDLRVPIGRFQVERSLGALPGR